MSARAAGIPKPTHSSPSVPELISLSEALPMMGIALCCVWAAYTTTELLEVAKSTVMSPEVGAHAAEPPEAAVLTSAPYMVVAPSNSCPACHITVEGTVDEHCTCPVNKLYLFPDITTVEPPEVAASAAESSEVSVVTTYESSSCPVTAMEAVYESSSCPVTAMEAVCELSSCSVTAMEAVYELPGCSVMATEAAFEPLACSEPAEEAISELSLCSELAKVTDCELPVCLVSTNVSEFELSILPVTAMETLNEFSVCPVNSVIAKDAPSKQSVYPVSVNELDSELSLCSVSTYESECELSICLMSLIERSTSPVSVNAPVLICLPDHYPQVCLIQNYLYVLFQSMSIILNFLSVQPLSRRPILSWLPCLSQPRNPPLNP